MSQDIKINLTDANGTTPIVLWKVPVPDYPDELSLLDTDLQDLFRNKSYLTGMPLLAQAIRGMAKLTDALKAKNVKDNALVQFGVNVPPTYDSGHPADIVEEWRENEQFGVRCPKCMNVIDDEDYWNAAAGCCLRCALEAKK